MRARDLFGVQDATRRFQHRDQPNMTRRQVALRFQLIDDFCNQPQVIRTFDLGQHKGGDALPDHRFEVANQQAPRPVDTHQHVCPARADLSRRFGDDFPCVLLAAGRNGILKIENDRIGAALRRLGDEPLGGDGHIKHGSPHGQFLRHERPS